MPEKKYKLKKYRQLDSIIDDIDNTRQKKYDIKRLLKRYSDKLNRQVDWVSNVEGNTEKAMNIKPTNNLHIMYEECKKYRLSYLRFKERCESLQLRNAMLEDENDELKRLVKHYREKHKSNETKFDILNLY
jgi:phosphoglycerate-specific signal transduction histidine kinase